MRGGNVRNVGPWPYFPIQFGALPELVRPAKETVTSLTKKGEVVAENLQGLTLHHIPTANRPH